MSKKGKKKGKKSEPEVPLVPTKTTFDIIFEQHLKDNTLSLAQQKQIVGALHLGNHSLFDSMTIDIVTDFLRFAKDLKLSAMQTEGVYRTLQSAIFKMKNDAECDAQLISDFLDDKLASQLQADDTADSEAVDADAAVAVQQKTPSKLSSAEQSRAIKAFFDERILSQFALYKTALFEKNPSNVRFAAFKEKFEIGDVVRFADKECLFKIEEFDQHSLVLASLHEQFQATESEVPFAIRYTVSNDQTQRLTFVSRPEKVDPEPEPKPEDEAAKDEENQDSTNKQETPQEEETIADPDKEKEDEAAKADTEEVVVPEEVAVPKTLIDVIVDKKVETKLNAMQQRFDEELNRYKEQIEKLQMDQSK